MSAFNKTWLVVLYLVGASFPLFSQPILFPADAVVNVLRYGENINDGVTDATAAIQQAIDENSGDINRRKTLYFPAGTYLLSAPVGVDPYDGSPNGGNGKGIILQGAGVEYTIFKLADNNPLFQDATAPLPVLTNAGRDTQGGWTAINFMNSCFDFTVDVGAGNPGAAGIRYISNNQGSLRNVKIVSSDPQQVGWAGLDLERSSIAGPALFKNIEIVGFDWGMRINGPNYGTTIEHMTIRDSKSGGIRSNQHIVNIRKLTTENIGGPAVANISIDGFLTIIDSDLGGSAGSSAIENTGYLFARNITATGFDHALSDGVTTVDDYIKEYVAGEKIKLWESSPDSSMNLGNGNIPETPEMAWDDTTKWVNVCDFGGGYVPGTASNPNYSDASTAIQAAIDYMNEPGNEALTTLYFQKGDYRFNTPINVYGNVKRIVGNFAALFSQRAIEKQPEALFTLNPTDYDTLLVERMNFAPLCCDDRRRENPTFLNNHQGEVVLRNIYIGHGKAYEKGTATKRVFLEDVCALSQYYYIHVAREEVLPEAQPQFDFKDQEVWARHFNPEQRHVKINSVGGQVWVLGLKSEEPGNVIYARDNAKVEVLGGTVLPSFPVEDGEPIIKLENAEGSFVFAEHAGTNNFNGGGYYRHILEERRGPESRSIYREDTQKRLEGQGTPVSVIPLYLAYGGERVAPSYEIGFLPEGGLDFGKVAIDETATAEMYIQNTGNSTLQIEAIEYPQRFSGKGGGFSLMAGKTDTVTITFAPTEAQIFSDTIWVSSNADTGGNYVLVTGEGFVPETRIIRLGGVLAFPDTDIGDSTQRTLTVYNDGNDTLQVTAINIPEGFSASPQNFDVLAEQSQAVIVQFKPFEAKLYSDVLSVTSNATEGVSTSNVAGRGVGEPLALGEDGAGAWQVYPNPVSDALAVSVPQSHRTELSLSIHTLSGKEIKKLDISDQRLSEEMVMVDVSGLSPGVYLLRINNPKGNDALKFVIER